MPVSNPLFTPVRLGQVDLPHRVCLAPLTRCRADGKGVPAPSASAYYAQRAAGGGLLISEATNISPDAQGYVNTPGLWNQAQVDAWKPIVAAVKAAHPRASFWAQLWHTGRVGHNAYTADGGPPYAPSAIACPSEGGVMLPDFSTVPYVVPRAMTTADIDATVDDYVRAAHNAVAAGFDGVEFHSANGYLSEQFLRASSNQRDDEYGPAGPHGRATFAVRVVDALVAAIGADRVGIRLSPWGRFLMDAPSAEDDFPTYDHLVKTLAAAKDPIAYLHVVEPRMSLGNEESAPPPDASLQRWRALWGGRPFIAAGGFNRERALAHCAAHPANELVSVGRWFLANPDLVARWAADGPDGLPLNTYKRELFYVGGDNGYIDYPTLDQVPKGTPTARARDGSLVFVEAEGGEK